MGTREPYLGTEREVADRAKAEAKAAAKTAREAVATAGERG